MCIIAVRSPIRRMDAKYQPRIVIGCAIEKASRRAMLRRRAKLAMRAKASESALMARSLEF